MKGIRPALYTHIHYGFNWYVIFLMELMMGKLLIDSIEYILLRLLLLHIYHDLWLDRLG